ncbi:hypothetical protein ACE3MQ_21645 [Paenibacillus lentus]
MKTGKYARFYAHDKHFSDSFRITTYRMPTRAGNIMLSLLPVRTMRDRRMLEWLSTIRLLISILNLLRQASCL